MVAARSQRLAPPVLAAAALTVGCIHGRDEAETLGGAQGDPRVSAGRVTDARAARGEGPAKPLAAPPRGPFGYSTIAAETSAAPGIAAFASYEDCADCHERQWEEMKGSLHTLAHTDPLYRHTAQLARVEAGEEIYAYCSGCHSPQGVTYKPWEVAQFLFERLVPPKGSESDTLEVDLPEALSAPLRIEATLFYRSAPPKVVAALLGDEAFELKRVAMTRAEAEVAVSE